MLVDARSQRPVGATRVDPDTGQRGLRPEPDDRVIGLDLRVRHEQADHGRLSDGNTDLLPVDQALPMRRDQTCGTVARHAVAGSWRKRSTERVTSGIARYTRNRRWVAPVNDRQPERCVTPSVACIVRIAQSVRLLFVDPLRIARGSVCKFVRPSQAEQTRAPRPDPRLVALRQPARNTRDHRSLALDDNANRPHSAHGELTPTEFALQWTTTPNLEPHTTGVRDSIARWVTARGCMELPAREGAW